jgi:hypothetical protein
MTDHDVQITALFGRPPTEDERAAAAAQAARLDAGIFENPILRALCDPDDPLLGIRLRSTDLVDLPTFSVPAP